ncbi:MAG TPA: dienelactone hydrolase family protein [Caulobacteraceae bacterium]|nr:dienelactone hydrolase family protein [Caulobacteraceae bacterium]
MTSLHYIAFASLHEPPLMIPARLRIPERDGRRPAVLILHGSAGPSEREGGYSHPLNEAGFVTLEPDQWSPRGLAGGAEGRPRTVHETLPDVYGSHAFLAAHPRVDPNRIGIMGFSFGGVATMLAATKAVNAGYLGDKSFAAYMPVYPVCHLYNRAPGFEFGDLVSAPLLLVTGSEDGYDNDPDAGPALARSLKPLDRMKVRTAVVHGAHHGFDMPEIDVEVQDPAGNRGQGGRVRMAYDAEAAERVHGLAVQFFGEMKGAGA